jgi:hypothetical protein
LKMKYTPGHFVRSSVPGLASALRVRSVSPYNQITVIRSVMKCEKSLSTFNGVQCLDSRGKDPFDLQS